MGMPLSGNRHELVQNLSELNLFIELRGRLQIKN
jgi:hypothetical protein